MKALAVKPEDLSLSSWTHKGQRKEKKVTHSDVSLEWKGKIPTRGFTASLMVLHIAGFAPSWSDGFLDRQIYLTQPPPSTEFSSSVLMWSWCCKFLNLSRWIFPSSGHHSRPLQIFILPLSLSNAARSFRLLEKLPERLGRFHREESRQGQGLPLLQGKRTVSSDPREDSKWNAWVLLLLVPPPLLKGHGE